LSEPQDTLRKLEIAHVRSPARDGQDLDDCNESAVEVLPEPEGAVLKPLCNIVPTHLYALIIWRIPAIENTTSIRAERMPDIVLYNVQ
jgi:hypothetical protein